ncbi:hypothetical protein D3C78_1299890 [compost metagenome]
MPLLLSMPRSWLLTRLTWLSRTSRAYCWDCSKRLSLICAWLCCSSTALDSALNWLLRTINVALAVLAACWLLSAVVRPRERLAL